MGLVFIVLVLLVLYPLGVAVVIVFGTKRAVIGRCFHCRYPLAGLAHGSLCPECGNTPSPPARHGGMPPRLALGTLGGAVLIDALALAALWSTSDRLWTGLLTSTISLSAMVLVAWVASLRVHPWRTWPLLLPTAAASIGNTGIWWLDPYPGSTLILAPIFTTIAGGLLFLACAGVVAVWNRRASSKLTISS